MAHLSDECPSMRQLSHLALAPFLLVALISPDALANESSDGEQLATMRIDGEIEVGSDGRASYHTLTTAVTDEIRAMIARSVVDWTFLPAKKDGAAVAARSKMRIILAARKQGDAYAVKIENVIFFADSRAKVPRGHFDVVGARRKHSFTAAGSLSLHVRLAPDGTILNATPTQCAVFALAPGNAFENVCKDFERYGRSLVARAKIIYRPAAGEPMPTGPEEGILPLAFTFGQHGMNMAEPGKWHAEWRTRYKPAPSQDGGVPRIGASDLTAEDGFIAASKDLPQHVDQGVGASDRQAGRAWPDPDDRAVAAEHEYSAPLQPPHVLAPATP